MHYRRIVENGAIYAQPFSEGGAAAAGAVAFGTEARPVDGGFRVSGKKIFASLSGAADYYGVLCTERAEGETASRRNTLYLEVPAAASGVSVLGDWDPLGMRGTVSRTLLLNEVFVSEQEMLMPRGLFPGSDALAAHVPHALPTYLGLAQAAYDFTSLSEGRDAGTPPVKRRMYPTKQIAVAEMHISSSRRSALVQAISEARPNPSKAQVLRAYAAQATVMENANAIASKALRTWAGKRCSKASRSSASIGTAGAARWMLPWTAEICLDRIGREGSTSRARRTNNHPVTHLCNGYLRPHCA
jgi:alkylation response protein AidB-like acyl-CoA dehydrogenase